MAKSKTSPEAQPAHLAMYREVVKLFDQQMNWWDLARRNHLALDNMERRTLYLFQGDGSSLKFRLQYNPERRRSATAPAAAPAEPPCFLCEENQPPEQMSVGWKSRWNDYRLQLNPYPILHNHLTIADMRHKPQTLNSGRLEDMVELSARLPGWVVFFNGARCGASAPGHFHFQAGLPTDVPLCKELAHYARTLPTNRLILHDGEKFVGTLDTASRFAIVGSAPQPIDVFRFLESALTAVAEATGDDDPAVNAITWCEAQRGFFALFPRRGHRPSCYGTGEGQHLVSPATLEMAGLWPVVRKEDFDALTSTDLRDIYSELCVDADTAASIVSQLKSIV